MIQQQLHLKRLEELTLLKSESQRQLNNQTSILYHQGSQFLPSYQAPFLHPNYLPINDKNTAIQIEQVSTPVQSDSGIKLNDLDEESLENLANIVYKKMMLKKKSSKAKIDNEVKKPKSQMQNEGNEESLVDLIIEETRSVNNFKKKNCNTLNDEEMEESKLIEDLFFIK